MPYFCGLAATSHAMPRRRRSVAIPLGDRPALLVGEGDQDGARDGSAARQDALGEQGHQGPGDAERDADAGVRRTAVVGERVVAPASADRLEPLVALHVDLDDGAGVVVEAARDTQVGLDSDPVVDLVARRRRSRRARRRARRDPTSSSSSVTPRAATCSTSESSLTRIVASARHRSACSARGTCALDQQPGHGLGRQLVELVDLPDRLGHVGDPEPAVEALDQLAVVDLDRQPRQGEPGQGLDHHPHHLDVVVERQLVATDDVDVGLGELAVATLLGPLATPRGLDLVAPERELQVAGVLQDVAGERDGQVEVQAQLPTSRCRPPTVVGLEPAQDVDLLVDLTALGEPVERLDGAGLDVGEAVQLEGARSEAIVSRSTTRAAGSSSGKPLSGVGRLMVRVLG